MAISFKHYYKSGSLIGSGTYKFRPYTIAEPLPQLATPQNVTAAGTTVSWDVVENATSYAVLADSSEIGTVEAAANLISFTIAGTSYQAEEGMTWAEWCNSSYNTDGYYVGEYGIYTSSGGSRVVREQNSTEFVMPSNTITNGQNYGTSAHGGAGN